MARFKEKYVNSKIKIFNNQTKSDIAFLNDDNLKKLYQNKNFSAKLKFIKNNPIKFKTIPNKYLQLNTNKDNVKFAYFITRLFKVKKQNF